ncbi:MAG: hypothetical protein [Circular genetic element sp.]|nr:MAG: hypothetical protein [Circular genetic element sp.]
MDARVKSALAMWSSPETLRGIGKTSFNARIRLYAGVLVPGCFFKKHAGGDCYLDECGKDECQRQCEYLLEVHSIVARFKKKGISVVGSQDEVLDQAFENLDVPATSQTNLSDWP